MAHEAGVSTAWRQSDTTLMRRTSRSVLIMPKGAEEPLRLVGMAIAIWDELEQPATDEHLVDRIAAQAGTQARVIRNEVVATRTALGHTGAITEAR